MSRCWRFLLAVMCLLPLLLPRLGSTATAAAPATAATVDVFDVKNLEKQARAGDAAAQSNLGLMYDQGRGLPQDDKEAVFWYRKAAAQGNAAAQFRLGLMYDRGRGVPQDDKEAVSWYRKAAAQGNAGAQTNLGLMYAQGQGVPQDDVAAYVLFNLAASNAPAGDNSAADNRNKVAAKMNRSQIEAAQALTRGMLKQGVLVALDAHMLGAKKNPAAAPRAKAGKSGNKKE